MKLAWKQIAVAFVAGICAGSFVLDRYGPDLGRHHGDDRFQQRLLNRFSSKLKLTPDQRSQVAAILESKRQQMDALRKEIRPRFEEIRKTTSAEVSRLLTAEQQEKFNVMQAEQEKRMEHFREQWKEKNL